MLPGNVHAGLGHHLGRVRVHPVLLKAGRIRLNAVALERPRPAFGHLAPARVPGAKEQHLQFPHCRLHNSVTSIANTFFKRFLSSAIRSLSASDRRTHATASRAAAWEPLPGKE